MRTSNLIVITLCLTLLSCNTCNTSETISEWKNEITQTERDFAIMAQELGITEAFLAFAADSAVLKRGNDLIIGKKALEKHFKAHTSPGTDETLIWEPDFVDISSSGDMAYTYGMYTYSYIDSTGTKIVDKGVFHTIWKRQADNSWKFVWD